MYRKMDRKTQFQDQKNQFSMQVYIILESYILIYSYFSLIREIEIRIMIFIFLFFISFNLSKKK